MVYFATANYGYKAGIQITASHNPKEYNGLKISRTNALPVGLDSGLDRLLEMATTQPVASVDNKGKVTVKDITDDYIKFQQKYLSPAFNDLKIGVDISNGAAAVIVQKIWGEGGAFRYINETLDGTFPAHSPNPLMPENTKQMQDFVKENGLDVGVVFDGDADRVVFVDDKGRHIPPDLIIAAMGEYFFADGKKPDGQVIEDIRTSKAVGEYLQRFGAETYMWKVGRANAAPRLREINGLYGGEYAGHYYFRDFFYSDSGIMAGSIMLNVVSNLKKQGRRLSDLIDEIARYQNSGEINFKIEDKRGAMERVKNFYVSKEKPTAFYDFDGYRVEYKDWWLNVRMSNTEPYLRLLCEATTKQLLDEKVAEITKLITT
jgi:phosphomannomutase